MKKTLLSLFTILGFAAGAQTLNQANHSYVSGDLYSTYPCSTVGVSSGASGAGSVWNYGSISQNTATAVNYTATANTNTSYTMANVKYSSGTNSTAYYSSSASDLKYYGGDMSINGVNATLGYSSPAVYAIYPMSLNSTTTSAISGSAVLYANNATFSGQCKILADATGTLTLPSGNTYVNAIRVLTTQTITVSGLPIGPATINLEYYDYYDPSTALVFKAPLFSISNSTLTSALGTSAQTFVTALKDNNVGISENQKSLIQLAVFPNPASGNINFATESTDAVKITAFDMNGKIVATEMMEMGKARMNLNNLATGVYMYNVTDKNNQVLKTGKFNVTK
ncbi:MAG: T9SS type A sorting domain-containing protein [Bacteroidota bacterium]